MQFLLFSVVPAPLTSYEGIEKLRPGHRLILENGEIRHECYWDLNYDEVPGSESQWAEQVREGMRAAVHRHLEGLRAESTGAYLSGGTDSSSVTAFLSEKFNPARTFSIFFSESRYDEIGYARTTAELFHTQHNELCLNPSDAIEAIPKITDYYDEPFANSSAIGSYLCAKMAREKGVETLLAGDGGDELFAGNERYGTDKRFQIYHRIPAFLRRGLIEPLARLLPDSESKLGLPRRYIRRANIPNPQRIFSYGLFQSLPAKEIFTSDFLAEAPANSWMNIINAHFQRTRASSELNRLMYLDLKLILADNDLRKVSGTAELAGVNVRYPLLDDQLAELSSRIPSRLKLKGSEKRYIFKQAMKPILAGKGALQNQARLRRPARSLVLAGAETQHADAGCAARSAHPPARLFPPGIFRQAHGTSPHRPHRVLRRSSLVSRSSRACGTGSISKARAKLQESAEKAMSAREIIATGLHRTGGLRLLERVARSYEFRLAANSRRRHWSRISTGKYVILCYHRVGTGGIPYYSELDAKEFEKQMRFLRSRYRILSLEQLVREIADPQSKGQGVAVTFDDGYRGLYTEALPILAKYQIPATVYLDRQRHGDRRTGVVRQNFSRFAGLSERYL